MAFEDPEFFWAMLLIVPFLTWYYLQVRGKNHGALVFPDIRIFRAIPEVKRVPWRHLLFIFRIAAILFIILAMMRPQKGIKNTVIQSEGVDIVLALDISGSMRAEDFIWEGKRYNRLHVVKEVMKDFIKKRKNDRIGLVVFAKHAYTQCPLTLDYGVLLQFLDQIDIGMIEDGTAIGDGMATAVNRLRKQESKSKLVVLLTDGVNNAGTIDPLNAAELAKAVGTKVYTVGVGGKGRAPFPVKDIFGNKVYQWAQIELDDAVLSSIAEKTGAVYFHATDTAGLKKVYESIDQMEKTKVEMNLYQEYQELFPFFLLGAVFFLFLEITLSNTKFRTVP